MSAVSIAAIAYAAATLVVVAFQIALALGAPWGRYAMGGRYEGRLPTSLRVAAAFQAVLLAALAVVVASAAGLVAPSLHAEFPSLIWVPVAVSAVSVGLNASRSAVERRTWVPVGGVLLASSLIVAVGA